MVALSTTEILEISNQYPFKDCNSNGLAARILEISNQYPFKDCNSNGLAARPSSLDTAFMDLLEKGAHLDLDRMPL